MSKVEVWSYDQITNPEFKTEIAKTICDTNGLVDLQLSDGTIRVSRRMAWLNLYWMSIPLKFGIPVAKRHFVKRISLNGKTHSKALTRYYDEIMGLSIDNAKRLKQVIWESYNELYEAASTWLLPYSRTIDILDMAQIVHDPKMEKIIKTREVISPLMSSKEIEDHVGIHTNEIMDLLDENKDGVANKRLLPYRRTDQLNKFQVPQTIYCFGTRTDIDDSIVSYPVVGSALSGLRNIMEYAVESLSAKKSLCYNHVAVADSQYFGRQQHLLASTVAHIYRGDCGSQNPIPYKVPEKKYENLIGKLIVEDGKYVWLTADNVASYAGKTVMMRSPLTCLHTDGVCEACAGRVIQNINRKLNIGILSAMHLVEPVTQGILSAKHLIKTKSIIHNLSATTNKVLYHSSASEIRWVPSVIDRLNGCCLGVPVAFFPKFTDVVYIRRDKPIKEESFSNLEHVFFRNKEGKVTKLDLVDKEQAPYFSAEFLSYVRDHYSECDIKDEIIWIPLEDTLRIPMMRVVIINDNLLAFVKKVDNFLGHDIREYTSCAALLKDFTDLLYSKVDVNIAHPEILLKAYMITSNQDFRIPSVRDQNDVHFQTTNGVLTYRHVGTCLAFEGLHKYLTSPSTYLTIKQGSPFDLMIGYSDY